MPSDNDTVERAQAVASAALDEWRSREEHRTLEDLGDCIVANLAAAGLLASTAAPQAADEDERPMVPHPTISESHIVPEVHITFRELADGEWDTSTWTEVAPGVNVQKDEDGRLACIEVESWKHAATASAPVPADDEAAVLRVAQAIARSQNPGTPAAFRSYREQWMADARAALAALREGQ